MLQMHGLNKATMQNTKQSSEILLQLLLLKAELMNYKQIKLFFFWFVHLHTMY